MHPRRTRPLLAVAVLSLAVFAVLAMAVTRGWGTVDLDEWIAECVAAHMPAWGEWLARPFSWLGGWIGITATSVLLVGGLLVARHVSDALWVAIGVSGIQLLTAVTKSGYDRPRPDEGSAIALPASSSFPSGHASGAVATAGIVAVLAAERWPRRQRLAWGAAAVVAVAIGASRVVLNVHYATDVVAGWCLGAAWLAALLLVRDALHRDDRHG